MADMNNNIRENSYKFECMFQSLRKTKEHISLTIAIHPNDVPRDLLADPIGARYMAVLVRVGDDEEIIPPPIQAAANRLVQSAGMLCREEKFQQWLVDSGCGDEISEESASKYLRRLLGINSRRQIAEEDHVARHFSQIRNIYESGQLLGAPDNAQVVF